MKDLQEQWNKVLDFFKTKFTDGEMPNMDTILFLIGVQELGVVKPNFSKDEKLNLMHIATCKLLEPYGYYEFDYFDDEAWPHYVLVKPVEIEKNKQELLIKEAIINYFTNSNLI